MDESDRIDALEARLGRVESDLRNLIDAIDVARAEANLDALYRVGSFALLALIALIGARAYHGQAKRDEAAASYPVG